MQKEQSPAQIPWQIPRASKGSMNDEMGRVVYLDGSPKRWLYSLMTYDDEETYETMDFEQKWGNCTFESAIFVSFRKIHMWVHDIMRPQIHVNVHNWGILDV